MLLKRIDEIRSSAVYSSQYEYQDESGNYYPEFRQYYDEDNPASALLTISCVTVTNSNLIIHNGLLENVIEFVVGFYVPTQYLPLYLAATSDTPLDGVSSSLSFLADVAGQRALGIMIDLIGIGTSTDDDIVSGDKIVYISFSRGLTVIKAKFVYSSSGEYKSSCYGHDTTYIIM